MRGSTSLCTPVAAKGCLPSSRRLPAGCHRCRQGARRQCDAAGRECSRGRRSTPPFGIIIELDFLMLETKACFGGTASVLGMNSLEAFVSALPKVELHVHLVGSAPLET